MKISVILVLALVFILLLFPSVIKADSVIVDNGKWGDNILWTLDNEGLLEISGQGKIPNIDWSYESAWLPHHSDIFTVVINPGITAIGRCSFYGCNNLTQVVLPETITSIGVCAFQNCEQLSNIVLPEELLSISDCAFLCCTNLNEIVLPNNLVTIGDAAFRTCTSLTGITIPNSVTQINTALFMECTNLENVTLSNNTTVINNQAFDGCTSLKKITIPYSVMQINEETFRNCSSLMSVEILNPKTIIGDSSLNVFDGCASSLVLHGYTDSTAEAYANASGYTFQAFTKMGTPDFTLPTCLTRIESESFSGAQMKIVYIPDGVTVLSSKAFANCMNLIQIRIPPTVTTISPDVFQNVTTSKLTIFGNPGSAAETFANSEGIKFEIEH